LKGHSDSGKHNRLINEKSPYLQQHAQNPVDWYPWSEEAFEKAKEEDKPIVLSIGYATCHWCHVMEHESFEDQEVADILNEHFVSIKVDREERPDIDKVYMQVAQMMTGRGGWPLTIIMTPEKQPFFAGTYIPKEAKYGRMGMLDFLPHIYNIWMSERDDVDNVVERIKTALSKSSDQVKPVSLSEKDFDSAFNHFSQTFDEEHGGFGIAPKFPSPHNLLFLLRYWKRSGDDWALFMVEKTLSEIRKGGIFDQIGYGFHRYSTDADWLVPHFEKMLYDQAMLMLAYTETYQATKNQDYAKIVEEIFEYVRRDMTSQEGGFYSAEDADSEGVEGKFYVWEKKEILDLLSKRDSEVISKAFNVEIEGNFLDEASREKTGKNILHLKESIDEIAHALNLQTDDVTNSLENARAILLSERARRVRPLKDTKILTDWNGLMIAALAKAGRVFDNSEYIAAAEQALDFILNEMLDSKDGIYHRYMQGEKAVFGFIDDYAFLIWALLEIYESTFKPSYLERSIELTQMALDMFWDDKNGGFFFSGNKGETLLVKQKEAYDGAIPSGNSVMALNLIRLSKLLANGEFDKKTEDILRFFSEEITARQSAFTMMLSALDFALGPSLEIVVVGDPESDETIKMIEKIRANYIPNKVVILKGTEEQKEKLEKLAPYTKHHSSVNEKATVYICENHNCRLPTNNLEQMIELLGSQLTV